MLGALAAAVAGWGLVAKLFGKQEATMQTAAQSKTQTPRALQGVFAPGPEHWVGDGFFVKTVFWPHASTPLRGEGVSASIRIAASRR